MSKPVKAGEYYDRTPDGRLKRVDAPAGARVPDAVICRRVVDYAPAAVPAGAAFGTCEQCGARIAFNPTRFPDQPHICMQCSRIEPLPIEGTDR